MMLEEIREQPRAIGAALREEDPQVQELTARIRSLGIHHVLIAARGTSDNAATYAKYLFEIVLGVPVTLAAPSVFTLYGAALKLPGCLAIGISQSGQAPDVVHTLEMARKAGALTACITNVDGSPILDASDFALLCRAGVERSVAATKTYTTTLALLALICARWSGNARLAEELSRVPSLILEALSLEPQIAQAVERYRYIEECAVLARGINQATALEAALKLMETSYVVAKPYSSADFLHGPIAMVSEGFPVFLYAAPGETLQSVAEVAHKLVERAAEMIVVSRDEHLLAMAKRAIRMPVEMDELLSPLVYIVPGQIWAYHFAAARGRNPDAPRGLSKVTLTR